MMVSEKYRAKNADDDADQKPMKFDEVTTEEDGLFGRRDLSIAILFNLSIIGSSR